MQILIIRKGISKKMILISVLYYKISILQISEFWDGLMLMKVCFNVPQWLYTLFGNVNPKKEFTNIDINWNWDDSIV